ncbi:MAG: hypothetical protein RLZZ234_284 [Candidatus Parcubacteria bacterium]|jgi:hypothetical protein
MKKAALAMMFASTLLFLCGLNAAWNALVGYESETRMYALIFEPKLFLWYMMGSLAFLSSAGFLRTIAYKH